MKLITRNKVSWVEIKFEGNTTTDIDRGSNQEIDETVENLLDVVNELLSLQEKELEYKIINS